MLTYPQWKRRQLVRKGFALLMATVGIALIVSTFFSCYATTGKPAPCVNIENCGNPADVPPLTDRHADGGR